MEYLIVFKKNGVLGYKDIEGYETRNISTFKCIKEADKIYNFSDFEITIHTGDGDRSKNHEYSYSKNSMDNLVPDFNFDSWPQVGINDYAMTVKEMELIGQTPAKISKVGWIGNVNTNLMRKKLWSCGRNSPRMDIINMKWSPSSSIKLNATTFLSMTELVETYSYLIDIEGYGYSGRLKYLLWSNRPVLLVDRPYKEYFFEHLKEWEHYIPVKRDLTDLTEKVNWCFDNPEKAAVIARNALEFSEQHLTREACYSRWNEIIEKL